MNILFLCVGNSARSQIAEALARDMFPKHFDIRSAGSLPAKDIHKASILTMKEIGIDITNNKPKSIDSIDKKFIEQLDYVITLCAEEICPVVPRATKVFHWPNNDPDNDNFSYQQTKNAFTKTRENIYSLLKKFLILENIQ